ncbi:MAG: glutathione-disulfide reductase [Cyanobacteria bacterium CRU_2_1]|nr:glutathione-disulfide reductase [Cyanobacteria bacterium RU_5_0]NJR62249.1 glutathione-disulfide reductase [Cyanobacteria bacterium CRU_2_1]
MNFDYDLFVIGAGSGGLAASKRAANYGAKVAIAEEDLVGGTCVIRGCIPKKLMVYASQFSHLYDDAIGYGWDKVEPHFDWQKLITAIDREVRRLSMLHISLLEKAGVTLMQGRALLVDPHTVAVGNQQFTAEKILIAVGSEAVFPKISGAEYAVTSRQMFKLPEQPQHIAIIGGGYISTEFACIMNGLGSSVTQILRGDLILRGFDHDIRTHLQSSLIQHGIQYLTQTAIEKIEKTNEGLQLSLSGGKVPELTVDSAILFAIGRIPNLDGIGLENARVAVERGGVVVNEFSQTSQPNIFAVGDCTNRVMLTPVAITEGRAFAETEFGNNPQMVSYKNIPTAVFSQPEVGTVGLTETEAKQQFGDENIKIYRSTFRPLFHNLTGAEERTLMKLLVDRQSDRVLGAHIVGKDAAEIIQSVAIALNLGATKRDFDATMAVHPSTAEEFVTMR